MHLAGGGMLVATAIHDGNAISKSCQRVRHAVHENILASGIRQSWENVLFMNAVVGNHEYVRTCRVDERLVQILHGQ
jgi:hypothetical protein